jgi:hypothetical protein
MFVIDSWQADMGLSNPAVGQAVNMLHRGYCEVQGDEDDETVCARRPIPAYIMSSIMVLVHFTPSPSIRGTVRARVLCCVFMFRADSCLQDPRIQLPQNKITNEHKTPPTLESTGNAFPNTTCPATVTSRHRIHRLATNPSPKSNTNQVEMANT